MKKIWKRCLAAATALLMTAGTLGFAGLAGAEPVSAAEDSVTVYISSQEAGKFLHPYGAYKVSADLAESYGYEDGVDDGVSALDVLVKAHELAGVDLENLSVKDGYVTDCFNGTSSLSFMIDGETPHYDESYFDSTMGIEAYNGKTIPGTQVGDGQRIEFFDYLDTSMYMDSYPYFYLADERINSLDAPAGSEVQLNVKALWLMCYGFATEPEKYLNYMDMVTAESAQMAWVNADGSITDIDGAVVDENGDVTISIPDSASAGDQLLLTAYVSKDDIDSYMANPVIMSVITVDVTGGGEVTGTFERGETIIDEPQGGEDENPADPQIEEATAQTLQHALDIAAEPGFEDEWQVLALARAGAEVPDGYYDEYCEDIAETLDRYGGKLMEGGDLPTDYAKVILALTAAGKDVTNVGGYDLTEILRETYEKKGGTPNQVSFVLIALNAAGVNRNVKMDGLEAELLDKLISMKNDDGGFSVAGSTDGAASPGSDVDVTAMAIQALTPYTDKENVKQVLDDAVEFIIGAQKESGGYSLAESSAQAVIALTALDMDPGKATDGKADSIIDSLMELYRGDGTFQYGSINESNSISTEQGMRALVAYQRYLAGEPALYDMSDVDIEYAVNDPADKGDDESDNTAAGGDVSSSAGDNNENGSGDSEAAGGKAFAYQTGDTASPVLWITLIALSGAAAAAVLAGRKKAE